MLFLITRKHCSSFGTPFYTVFRVKELNTSISLKYYGLLTCYISKQESQLSEAMVRNIKFSSSP